MINENGLLNIFPTAEASGSIVSFENGADGIPMESLSVAVEPTQDLHGYSHPWPGGGGKNLIDFDQIVTQSVYTPVVYLTEGTYYFYVANDTSSAFNSFVQISTDGNTFANITTDTESPNAYADQRMQYNVKKCIVTVVAPTYCRVYIQNNAALSGATVKVLLTKDATNYSDIPNGVYSNDPYFEQIWTPYSNICPISGRTGVSVYDDPKYGGTIKFNQKFPTKTLSYVGTNYTITSNNDGKFTVNATATASQSTNVNHTSIGANAFTAGHVYAWIGNSDKIKVDLKAYAKYTDTIFKATTASYNNIVFVFDNLTAGTYEVFPQLFDLTEMFGQEKAEEVLSAEQSSTGSGVAWFRNLFYKDYYPYNAGETTCVSAVNCDPYWKKTVDWTSQAGTVYGGTVDPVAGQLTVDWAMVDMGTLTWDYITNDGTPYYFRASADGRAAGSFNVISSIFKTSSAAGTRSLPDCGIVGSASASYVYIRWDAYTDAATFKAAMSGVQLCYELATPLTYQLTAQEVATLLGANRVWSDAGDISLVYHTQVDATPSSIDGLFINGEGLQADGWFLKWRKLAAPKPKTDYVSVWGRDGDIDLTESETDGQVFYENRELTMDMVYIGEDWTDAYSELLDMLHGKECAVQFSNDPYWYWAGRIIASLYEHKPHSLTMSGIMFPYKLSVAKITKSATVSGAIESNGVDVVLPSSRMRVSPKVTVVAGTGESVTLKWGTKTQTLSAGTYYVRGLKVGSDDVTIKVWGTGTVTFEYRKGML